MEFEGLKHEIKVLEEETVLLNSQLEDALRLRDISEGQLEEALNALKSEREQKNNLRKELAHHLSLSDCVYGTSTQMMSISVVEGFRFADEQTTNGTSASGSGTTVEDSNKCNACNGHADKFNNEYHRPAGRKGEVLPPVSSLFGELNLSEIQKLKQQLIQVSFSPTLVPRGNITRHNIITKARRHCK